MSFLLAAALLCSERPANAVEVESALSEMAAYSQTLAEYSFKFRWTRPDTGVRSGSVDVSPAGRRIAVESAAGNPEGNRGPPREFYFDNRRWRSHQLDPATRSVAHIMLFTDPPSVFVDFSPVELLCIATSASNPQPLVETLRGCRKLDGFIDGDQIRLSGLKTDGDRYQVAFRTASPPRLISIEKRLESLKESPVPIRFIRVLASTMVQGISVPTKAAMGFRDFSRDKPGVQSGVMEISDFRLSANPGIEAALARESDASIPMLDRATGVERQGRIDPAALKKRMTSSVDDAKKELERLGAVSTTTASGAPRTGISTYFVVAAAAAVVLGAAAWFVRRREEAA